MWLYERHMLPRVINVSMRQERLVDYRQATVSAARGTVVEIGLGSGHNLSLYGPPVDRVFALDASPELLRMAESRLAKARDHPLCGFASVQHFFIAPCNR